VVALPMGAVGEMFWPRACGSSSGSSVALVPVGKEPGQRRRRRGRSPGAMPESR
jgi:hypothetical protein